MTIYRFKFKRDPAAEWTLHNPILKLGEPGYETDTNKLKVGDGFSRWNELDYLTGGSGEGPPGDSAYQVAVDNGFVGTEVEWLASLVGAQGPQGIQGVPGIDGEDGAQGPQGIQGVPGADGEDGAQGPQGIQGVPGADGEDGAQGPQGIQGVPGADGEDGAQGPPGPAGDDGGYYPSHAYGMFSMSGPPIAFENSSYTGNDSIQFTRLWVPAGKAINGVALGLMVSGVNGGSAGAQNGFSVYSSSGTQLAFKSGGADFWEASPGWLSLTFDTPIAAEGTGRFVYISFLVQGYPDNPYIMYRDTPVEVLNGGVGVTNRRHFYNNGVTTFPATIDTSSYGSTSSYMALCGIF